MIHYPVKMETRDAARLRSSSGMQDWESGWPIITVEDRVAEADPRVDALLANHEWQIFECKRARIKPRDALPSVVALANAEGGIFVLGLEDPDKAEGLDRLYGIGESLDNIGELLNLIPKHITPMITGIDAQEIAISNRDGTPDRLLVIRIPKSPLVHSTRDGDTWLRHRRSNRRQTAEEIVQLKYAKGELQVEDEPAPKLSLDDLDSALLDHYREAVGAEEADLWTFLRKNGLAVTGGELPVLNKAAALLFAENPSIALRAKCGIKVAVYRGTVRQFTGTPNLKGKPFSIEGPLYQQIRQCLDFLRQWRDQEAPVLQGAGFQPAYRYPDYALQEAIANAVIHRDYSIQNDIQVRVFDDRIEVESPGALAGPVTVRNIREVRFARNPIILRTLNRFPDAPNLDIGEGVKRMFAAVRQAGLADPVYEEPESRHAVLLTLLHRARDTAWDQVEAWLLEHGRITNQVVRRISGIEDTVRVSRMLRSWVDEGKREAFGTSKRQRHYVLPADQQSTLF